jgi:hypothetical protein
VSPTIVKAMGCTAPAPRPWSVRKAMSIGIDVESPQSMEPMTNSARPKRKIGLRP